MADQQKDSGFKLPSPTPSSNSAVPLPPTATQRAPAAQETKASSPPATPYKEVDASAREMIIGSGVLLVLVIGFFFAKNAFATSLVGKRVAPNRASAAGWWLFIFLSVVAAGLVGSVVDQNRFLSFVFMIPLAVLAVVSLVLTLILSRR